MGFLVLFAVFSFALLQQHPTDGHLDLTVESGCHDTEFRLACTSLTGKIAIFGATFSPGGNGLTESTPPIAQDACERRTVRSTNCNECNEGKFGCINPTTYERSEAFQIRKIDFRGSINRRCSGLNYCSFLLKDDYQGASKIGSGAVIIRYACVEDKNITKTCNVNVNVWHEGLARTPGYPSYYIGGTTCMWTLKAPPYQRLKIKFLDLSIRTVGPHESDCLDWITVTENGLNLIKLCGDLNEDIAIYSQSSALNVTFVANSRTLYPKRGFLFYYKVIGCPAVKKPEDGYLINRNDSFVHFRCCVGFVFPDTLLRDKVLHCHEENTWSERITDCVSFANLLQEEINSIPNSTSGWNLTSAEARLKMESNDPVKDVILPAVIILILFVGNAIVLYVIYKQRKKLSIENDQIELKTLKKAKDIH